MNLDQKLTSPRLRLWNVFFDQHSCRTGISQAHRFHSSPLRLVNRSGTNRLLVERCQLRAVIGNEVFISYPFCVSQYSANASSG
jgi:hypothetical protein